MVAKQSHSDGEDLAMTQLVALANSSDTLALLLYKMLGRIVKSEMQIEKLEAEIARLKND